ncbi:MAG: segregation/condensation protein A [Planctomycetes bacterium]|nr:segregation/condensation protein A [Planctomycetota bacterium]
MSFDTDSGRDHEVAFAGTDDDVGQPFDLPGGTRDPGLGLLLEMARRGEYDPWDIDIVALTDRYLRALDERLDARDLGHVARLIFYAAALVHLKAQALAEREARLRQQEAFDAALDAQMEELADALRGRQGLLPGDVPLVYPDFLGEGGERGGVAGLMPRERRPRERGLTLVDLIAALRAYDERLAQRELELANQPVYDEALLADECVGSSHQDDLDQDIVEVRHALWRRLEREDAVARFEELTGPGGRTRAGAYLALLFLAQDGEVVLDQEACYGELRVRRGPHFGEVRAGVRHDDDDEAPAAGGDEARDDEGTGEAGAGAAEEGEAEVESELEEARDERA